MNDGLRFVIYNKAGAYRRDLVGLEANVELAPNVIPTAEFTIDDDHVAVADITADGARCAVWFRGAERFRGIIDATPGEGPEGTLTVSVEGDLRKMWDWQGWQSTAATLSTTPSTIAQEYAVYTGKSEAVFKAALAANIARLGAPVAGAWSVVADHGYGTPGARAELRMHPLGDKLIPLLDADRLIVTLAYPTDTTVRVDVREPDLVPGVLTLASGVPDGYTFTREKPTATRVVVGGRGEGAARQFVQVIDAGREADWGDIIEVFKDARNSDDGSDITIDGREALAEGAPRVGISTDLVETRRFMYGTTYLEGDLVHVRVGPVDSTEQISVSISESPSTGVVVTPHIGAADESTDTDTALAVAVARLARGVRDSGRR